jgi:hypothetical protein
MGSTDNIRLSACPEDRGSTGFAFATATPWNPIRLAGVPLGRLLGCLALLGLLLSWPAGTAASPTDDPDLLKPLQKEAERGLPSAQYALGRRYMLGRSLQQDVSKGLALLQQAAAKSYPPALLFLGRVYERGIGLPRNYIKAKGWYKKAAEHDIEAASIKLAPFRNVDPNEEFTLFNIPLTRATPFAIRFALAKRGAEKRQLMSQQLCDIYVSNGLLSGSDLIRACYTEESRLAHIEYRFPPDQGQPSRSLSDHVRTLTAKYGQPKVQESSGVTVRYSWKVKGVHISLSMDHPSQTAFLRYTIEANQKRYLQQLKARQKEQRPTAPEL